MGFEKKIFSGGMDKDSEIRLLKEVDYRDALNIQAVSSNTGSDGAVESIWGNFNIYNTYYQEGDVCIGAYEDKQNQQIRCIYYFIANRISKDRCKVFKVAFHDEVLNSQYSRLIASGSGLNFVVGLAGAATNKITGVALVDSQYLYWTDDYNEPRKLMLISSVTNNNVYINQSEKTVFNAVPAAPSAPPFAYYTNNNTSKVNNLNNKLYQFKYRIVYKDGTKSAFSPISKVCLPNYVDSRDYANNRIVINFNLQAYNILHLDIMHLVDYVELAARDSNLSDFEIIKAIDQAWFYDSYVSYNWDNIEATRPLDVNESNAIYSFIPLKAKALELINGNRLAYANFVEGYDNVNVLGGLSVGYTGTLVGDSYYLNDTYGFGHVPVYHSRSVSIPGEPTSTKTDALTFINVAPFEAHDPSIYLKILNFETGEVREHNIDLPALGGNAVQDATIVKDYLNGVYGAGSINTPFGDNILTFNPAKISLRDFYVNGGKENPFIIGQTVKTWKKNSYHTFGIVYYDYAGRPGTVNLFNESSVYVRGFSNNYGLGKITINVTISNIPPVWAYSYQIVYGGNTTYLKDLSEGRSYLQLICHGYNVNYNSGKGLLSISLKELTNIQKEKSTSVLSYGYTKGDRIRILGFYKSNSDGIRFRIDPITEAQSSSGITTDFKIEYFDTENNRAFIKVDEQDGLFYRGKGIGFEIYSPAANPEDNIITPNNNNVYYEIGEWFAILNPGLGTRGHAGNIQSQPGTGQAVIQLNSGDSYLKNRIFYNYNILNDAFATTDAKFYYNEGLRTLNVEEAHYSDFYNSNDYDFGRVNVVDLQYKQLRRPASVRYSDVYIPETNINGLGTFFDTSFIDYDKQYGSIQKLLSEDNSLLVFHENKVGKVFVNESILQDAEGQVLIQKSTNVLSEIQYYSGEYGISTNPESLAVFGSAKYFTDARRGAVLRLSTDGITKISDYGMRTFFADFFKNHFDFEEFPMLATGTYNARTNEYVLALRDYNEEVSGYIGDTHTLFFNEQANKWTTFASFKPEWLVSSATDFISFNSGLPWRHNNKRASTGSYDNYNTFYGTNYQSTITQVSNQMPSNIKFYKAISVESNLPWTAQEITNLFGQSSIIDKSLFKNIEGVYWAGMLRDSNTPNVTLPLYNGRPLRGHELIVKFVIDGTTYFKLFSVGFKYENSEMTNR